MDKKKLSWKDLSLSDFKVYFFSLFKAFIPKTKIKTLDELEGSNDFTHCSLFRRARNQLGRRYRTNRWSYR